MTVTPGQDPQLIFDSANAGDLIQFLPGLHQHGINNSGRDKNAILYVDKPINIELMAGAVLRLADNSIPLTSEGEITTNQGVSKVLDDLSIGLSTNYTLTTETDYYVKIDGVGSPNTFEYGTFTPGPIWNPILTGIPITGNEQLLQDEVYIKFDNLTGHNSGSIWYLSFDGLDHYGIRVGDGFHVNYIEDINIFGQGEIDLNIENNLQPSFLVADIPAAILFHGRIRRGRVQDITMKNCHRPFMAYGAHNGTYNPGGSTTGGESFDMEQIDCLRTTILNTSPLSAGILLGHPSHRGKLTDVRCNYNNIQSITTTIECNFNLDQYEVIGNRLKDTTKPAAIHCWRKSTNGLIAHNTLVGDYTNKPMVLQHAPGGWELPENIIELDNFNLNSVYVPEDNCPPPSNGLPTETLALYMRYDDNLVDQMGNTGITEAGTSFVDGLYSGVVNNAIHVPNANGARITIPHNDSFSFVDGNGDLPWSFSTVFNSYSILGRYFLSKSNGSVIEYQVIQGHNTKKVRVRQKDDLNGGQLFIEGSTVLQDNDVIVVTSNGSGTIAGIKIYINKVLEASYTDLSTGTYVSMQNTGADLHIGGNGASNQPGANADFDETGLWGVELSQSEVNELTDILTSGNSIV